MRTVSGPLGDVSMDHVTNARNEIEPLLTQLIRQLGIEGRATETVSYTHLKLPTICSV